MGDFILSLPGDLGWPLPGRCPLSLMGDLLGGGNLSPRGDLDRLGENGLPGDFDLSCALLGGDIGLALYIGLDNNSLFFSLPFGKKLISHGCVNQ